MRRLLISVLAVSLLLGCKKDDYYIPSLITEMGEATVKGDKIQKIEFDDGNVMDLSAKGITIKTGKNGTFRCIATYSTDEGNDNLYDFDFAFCTSAQPADSFKTKPQDPLKLVSIWKSSKYINMRLGMMTTDAKSHSLGFCIDSIYNRKLCISLLHLQPDSDTTSYTRTVYASLPINTSKIKPLNYDSVELSINTFNGLRRFTF